MIRNNLQKTVIACAYMFYSASRLICQKRFKMASVLDYLPNSTRPFFLCMILLTKTIHFRFPCGSDVKRGLMDLKRLFAGCDVTQLLLMRRYPSNLFNPERDFLTDLWKQFCGDTVSICGMLCVL